MQRFAPYIKHARSFSSPAEERFRYDKSDAPSPGSPEHDDMVQLRPVYMSLVGALIWISTMTRHELAFSVSQLARALTNPGKRHFDAAIRVLIYLHSTIDQHLVYKPNKKAGGLTVYVDSDWAASFSCSGAYFMHMGCPFYWFSKMQHSIALSSAEAEYFGCMLALKDVIFFRELFVFLGIPLDGATTIFTDSKSAVDLSYDHVSFKGTKHILRAAEFLRDSVARLIAVLRHLSGRVMIADILTKSLPHTTLRILLRRIAELPVHNVAVAN